MRLAAWKGEVLRAAVWETPVDISDMLRCEGNGRELLTRESTLRDLSLDVGAEDGTGNLGGG